MTQDCPPPSRPGSASSPASETISDGGEDIWTLSLEDQWRVVRRQIPAKLRKGVYFDIRMWQDRPWIEAYRYVDADTQFNYSLRVRKTLCCATLNDGTRKYYGRIIHRCIIPDEFLAALALML